MLIRGRNIPITAVPPAGATAPAPARTHGIPRVRPRQGGKAWFFIAPDYTFGRQLARDGAAAVEKNGGTVKGTVFYPFPSTADFSALLLQAQSSGATVLAPCNGGADMIGSVKQAREFGLDRTMKIISLLSYDTGGTKFRPVSHMGLAGGLAGRPYAKSIIYQRAKGMARVKTLVRWYDTDIRGIGLEGAHGLMATQTYYWDLNDRRRAFNKRVGKLWPNMANADLYSSTLHYLKAAAGMGLAAAKEDGRAVIERMKAMPTGDDAFGPGSVRADGRKLSPAYLMEVKQPSESNGPYDVLKLISTVPADSAWRPLSEGGCPLIKT